MTTATTPSIKRFTIVVLAATSLATQGCTLAMMQRMSGPSKAKAPPPVSAFPAAEAKLERTTAVWAARNKSTILRAYLRDDDWSYKDGYQYVGVSLFVREAGGAMNKSAEGEEGVCIEYPCSLERNLRDGWNLACDDQNIVKVYCSSVDALRAGP